MALYITNNLTIIVTAISILFGNEKGMKNSEPGVVPVEQQEDFYML